MEKKKVDVAAHLRKIQLLNPSKPLSSQGGFKCEACSAAFKSYDIFLDHQNSKIHLTNVGFDKKAKPTNSSVNVIKEKLEALKKQKAKSQEPGSSPEEALEKRLELAQKREEYEKKARYEKKRHSKKLRKLG